MADLEGEAPRQKKDSVKKSPVVSFLLSSLKLSVILFLLIALSAAVGTIMPEKEAAESLSHCLGPGVISFLSAIQLFDIYRSFWFFMLVGALSVNIVICSLFGMRVYGRRRIPAMPERFTEERTIGCNEAFIDCVDQIKDILLKNYHRVESSTVQRERIIYSERGYRRRFFTYFIHTGVLIIIGGMFIGYLYGVEGMWKSSKESRQTRYAFGMAAASLIWDSPSGVTDLVWSTMVTA